MSRQPDTRHLAQDATHKPKRSFRQKEDIAQHLALRRQVMLWILAAPSPESVTCLLLVAEFLLMIIEVVLQCLVQSLGLRELVENRLLYIRLHRGGALEGFRFHVGVHSLSAVRNENNEP